MGLRSWLRDNLPLDDLPIGGPVRYPRELLRRYQHIVIVPAVEGDWHRLWGECGDQTQGLGLALAQADFVVDGDEYVLKDRFAGLPALEQVPGIVRRALKEGAEDWRGALDA